MEIILSGQEMASCDQQTSNVHGMSSEILMERAALKMADFIENRFSKDLKIGILCGPGNNGGDGVALARILKLHGRRVGFYVLGSSDRYSPLMRKQISVANSYGISPFSKADDLKKADIVVDCVFGTGLHREVEGEFLSALKWFDGFSGIKIACDIPSGINADNGQVLGFAPHCDYTLTFGYRKIGHLLYPGREYTGEIHTFDVGIYLEQSDGRSYVNCFKNNDLQEYLPTRRQNSNKGSFGKVLIIAGSEEMSGAAYLSSASAFSVGVGLVYIYTHEKNREILGSLLPEAIIHTYGNEFDPIKLSALIQNVDAILIGPGLGQSQTARELLSHLVRSVGEKPCVFDADALNLIALDQSRNYVFPKDTVITPHIGEMSRLTGNSISEIKSHVIEIAHAFSKRYDICVVLKDAATVISAGSETYINESGNSGMATAGSGDVLAGMIVGFIAQGMESCDATPLSVYLHGAAGDRMAAQKSEYSLKASDLITGISLVLKEG